MASIRTVSSTFEIDPRMMHASSYIKVETSAPLGDSLIHTQAWQFIMTCWDGFESDLLGKLVWIIQDHVIFIHFAGFATILWFNQDLLTKLEGLFSLNLPGHAVFTAGGRSRIFWWWKGCRNRTTYSWKRVSWHTAFGGIHTASFFEGCFFFGWAIPCEK